MSEETTKNAILYIFERAENKEITIGKTRLIKLLYLLDVENYKLKKEVLTGFDWIFFKYGPYAFEVDQLLDKLGIEEEEIHVGSGKFISKLTRELEEEEIELELETKTIIEKLIDDWGTADLNMLLDYVYFETEPMYKIEYKQKLDFSKVEEVRAERKVELSEKTKERLELLGKRMKKRLEEVELPEEPFVQIPPAFKAKSFFQDEVTDLSKLSGKVKVKDA